MTQEIEREIIMLEPSMTSYREGKSSYIITCDDGKTTLVHKDLVTSRINNRLTPKDEQKHIHVGEVIECWDCGKKFCTSCKGEYGNMLEAYCGY